MTWTQPICDDCWDKRHASPSPRRNEGEAEICAYCGMGTFSGLYVRANPAAVPYPRR